jgi:type II secretory pathway pseudopilin PulG
MVDEVGASSGTLSQADKNDTARSSGISAGRWDDTDKANKDNRCMGLAGQGRSVDQRGYAMAALLVGMSVMAVMMAAALPVWSHAGKREREEELIWRGEQYKRAIMLFQRKYANTFPPSLDVLVEQKFLRKKYKDPITNDDFQIIPVGGAAPGAPGVPPGLPGGGTQPGAGTSGPGAGGFAPPGGTGGFGQPGAGGFGQSGAGGFGQQATGGLGQQAAPSGFGQPVAAPGGFGQQAGGGFGSAAPGMQAPMGAMGIQGVTSKSKEQSIKLYNGMDRYNQWAFVALAESAQPGLGGPSFARPGQGVNQPGGAFGQPGGGFGLPGGGFGQPGGGFGQPGAPGSGFGQPGSSGFGQPGGMSQPTYPPVPGGGFGTPGQPGGAGPGSGIFTPVKPGSGQPPPP